MTKQSSKPNIKQHTIVQDETYQHMYRIVYPDGEVGEELSNKAWAEEHCRLLNQREDKDENSKS
jgi:hypothetical protein